MWRNWTNWARVLIALGGVVLFYAMMAVVGLVVDGPARAISRFAAGFGPGGSALGLFLLLGGLFGARYLVGRRDERRQVAETGIIDVPGPIDHRREARRYFTWTAPLWLAVLALFVLAVASNFTAWRPW